MLPDEALRVCVIGPGRLGATLVASLRKAGVAVSAVVTSPAVPLDPAADPPRLSLADGVARADVVWITVPDDALHRVANGEAIDFTGRAVNDSGDERKVAGRAVPTGRSLGSIQVRVFVTRRISIDCNTTYEFVGLAEPPPPVTPR